MAKDKVETKIKPKKKATRPLTNKQESFVQELIKGSTQRQAYINAGYIIKTKAEKTIDENACRLLKTPPVAKRYAELRKKMIKRTEEKALMTADEIIAELVSIARDDISNYLDYRTEKVVAAHDDDGKPIFKYDNIVDLMDSQNIETKNISEVSVGRDGQFKFKLYERDKALHKLAEILGVGEINKQKVESQVTIRLEGKAKDWAK